MGRFLINTGNLSIGSGDIFSQPTFGLSGDHAMRYRLDDGFRPQTEKKLRIIKNRVFSTAKSAVNRTLVGDISGISERFQNTKQTLSAQAKDNFSKYVDPADKAAQNSVSTSGDDGFTTLSGTSDKRAESSYFTPYGSTATDFIKMRIKDTSGGGDIIEFFDLSAIINISQKKNILMTRVEGRDRSRKEFISGGDYTIKVSGTLYGDAPELYPYEKVQALRAILEYSDVINVKSPFLATFGINGIIITDFQLTQSKASTSKQAYQFTAVYEPTIDIRQAEEAEKLTKMQGILGNTTEWVSLQDLELR